MTGMSDREKAFENKFVHDEELKFKAFARRNKLLGLWAASELRMKDVESYSREVVDADLLHVSDDDIIEKVKADFFAAGISITDSMIASKLLEFHAVATRQLFEE